MIKQVKKRSGQIVDFNQSKITTAIRKAFESVNEPYEKILQNLSDKAVELIGKRFVKEIPSIEQVQDIVEEVLINENFTKVAKAYILYRQKRTEIREIRRQIIGRHIETKISPNTLKVLRERYLLKDPEGNVVETPDQLFRRVARNVSLADQNYGNSDVEKTEQEFYELISSRDFLPNTPTLMNAGTQLHQLSACFVLPVEDSLESIFSTLKDAALIHQSGGGTGFSFSRLRPKSDVVMSTKGVASGPVSFMKVYDSATDVIKQGGRRRGANMAILRVDHPDILEFISAKEKTNVLTNFNISVAIDEKFMKAVRNNEDYDLINPRTGKSAGKLNAKHVFNLIVLMAWKNGEPGIVFLDRINRDNPTPQVGNIESTNPCGEQPLLPYEACNLGSINLSNFFKEGKIDYERLGKTVKLSVHFLDNVIDMSRFPLPQIEEITKKNRKIGLGAMGFADLLIRLGIPYNSDDGIKTAKEIMKFIKEESIKASAELAEKRGAFPNFKGSLWDKKGYKAMRNSTVNTIAPTGTLSMIAECSSGIEPIFAVSYVKRVLEGKELSYVNQQFEKIAKEKGFYSDDLMKKISNKGSIQTLTEIPEDVRKIFVTAHDITPKWHVAMQAAFQEFVDNAVSKTVNFPANATVQDVEEVYLYAYRFGCKGVTIYRDLTRELQVLNVETAEISYAKLKENEEIAERAKIRKCPECGGTLDSSGGCLYCPDCGYSVCV